MVLKALSNITGLAGAGLRPEACVAGAGITADLCGGAGLSLPLPFTMMRPTPLKTAAYPIAKSQRKIRPLANCMATAERIGTSVTDYFANQLL